MVYKHRSVCIDVSHNKMSELIENIRGNLIQNHPSVNFEFKGAAELVINANNEEGFDILIQESERENTIHFGTWHFHFDNDDNGKNELIDYLIFGMSKLGRLKAYSRSGNEYKWTFETKDEYGNWHSAGNMGLMNIKFWIKSQVRYYQNDLIDPTQKTQND